MNNSSAYTRLIVRDLELIMSIGIYDHEKTAPQRVIINIEADIMRLPHQDDDIETTISYEKLIDIVTTLSQHRHYNLVEAFAEDINNQCLSIKNVNSIKLRIEKPDIIDGAIVGIETHKTGS